MRTASLLTASLFLFTTFAPAVEPKPAPAAAVQPEVVALKVIAALRANDLELAYKALPADLQKLAEKQWDERRADKEGLAAQGGLAFDQQIQRHRAANAVDDLTKEFLQVMKENAEQIPQSTTMLRSLGAMISPMIDQAAKGEPKIKALGSTFIELAGDIAGWIETANTSMQDPKNMRQFVSEQVAGFKALKINSSADLAKLTLPQALRALSPLVKHYKAAMQVSGIQADAFLDSIKITAKATGKLRDLDMSFSAFGKPRKLWLRLQQTEAGWEIDPALLAPVLGAIGLGLTNTPTDDNSPAPAGEKP